MNYFAYGTNLNLEIVEKKGLYLRNRRSAILKGYELVFNKKSIRFHLPSEIGFANIQENPSSVVEGGVYEIAEKDIAVLDKTERVPEHYQRIEIEIQLSNGETLSGFTYQAQKDKTGKNLIPSRNYINHILKARAILSEPYCKWLENLKTYNSECACCHKDSEVLFLKENDQMFVICASCRESKTIWGDVRGKPFSVLDTEAVMQHVLSRSEGYSSLRDLINSAIKLELIKS